MGVLFPLGDRVDCRVGFQGNPSRNDKAMDVRMTDMAERDGPGPKGRQPKRAMAGTRSPGVISHPRLPFSYLVIDWYSALLPHHVIARAKPVAIHCEPENEETTPSASSETRWIAASLASLFPRNDKDRHVTEPPTSFPFILSSRGLKARGDPL
jgi:hypothetical protein